MANFTFCKSRRLLQQGPRITQCNNSYTGRWWLDW